MTKRTLKCLLLQIMLLCVHGIAVKCICVLHPWHPWEGSLYYIYGKDQASISHSVPPTRLYSDIFHPICGQKWAGFGPLNPFFLSIWWLNDPWWRSFSGEPVLQVPKTSQNHRFVTIYQENDYSLPHVPIQYFSFSVVFLHNKCKGRLHF